MHQKWTGLGMGISQNNYQLRGSLIFQERMNFSRLFSSSMFDLVEIGDITSSKPKSTTYSFYFFLEVPGYKGSPQTRRSPARGLRLGGKGRHKDYCT
ncbi:hypothetical protein J6590_008930 [Homalodisca vitripennis]|nr:hypothetical protein J6590_008930 [Homalodisca vitripennis]